VSRTRSEYDQPTPDHPSPDDAGHRPVARHNDAAAWRHILVALRQAGQRAGAGAADWWAQDSVGGRATGNTAATARAVLAGIDDGDPAILNALPVCDLSGQWADSPTEADLYTDAAPADAPGWDDLDTLRRGEAIEAYRDGFDTAAHQRVAEHCRTALPDSDTGAAAPPSRRRPGA